MTYRQLALFALERINEELQGEKQYRFKLHGICALAREILVSIEKDQDAVRNALTVIKSLFSQWEEFSGDLDYPVPAPKDWRIFMTRQEAAVAIYYVENDMWIGEYGAARIRLLNFLIKELSQ